MRYLVTPRSCRVVRCAARGHEAWRTYDTALGDRDSTSTDDWLRGSSNESPVLSAKVTINGRSLEMASTTSSDLSVYNDGEYSELFVSFRGLIGGYSSFVQFSLSDMGSAYPATLDTPFSIAPQPAQGPINMFNFTSGDTQATFRVDTLTVALAGCRPRRQLPCPSRAAGP
jgi:hypothetical protein